MSAFVHLSAYLPHLRRFAGDRAVNGGVSPSAPDKPQSPERYFAALDVRSRLRIIQEQLSFLQGWQPHFIRHALMVSVNIDGIALQALQRHAELQRQITAMPYLRFELVEHAGMALGCPLQQNYGCGAVVAG
ncbi:Cyclic di-GMP phosphodiesterase YhjH [Serratia plymuthica]|uniref:Cyclic di-GMP phosphodiesterase YhjH n=1 Tax=Serratia plymuthica TaxID=82996 RepID=A0A2X4VI03_SERPL|nr:Cyclic di-GMP phosphodiesterase YhjH [Serratia plymuthica]